MCCLFVCLFVCVCVSCVCFGTPKSVTNLETLPNAILYETFAYHIELLLPFVPSNNGMSSSEWRNRYSWYSMSDRQIHHGRAAAAAAHRGGLKRQWSVQSDLAKRGGSNNNKDTLSNSLPSYTGGTLSRGTNVSM